MDTHATPATGDHTANGLPHGRTSLTPHLVVTPAEAALEFYADVFGATVGDVTRFADVVAHAELEFGTGWLTLSDPLDGYGLVAPDTERGASFSLALYGSILDPFGVRWSVLTRVEDLSPQESARRVAEWAATQ